VRVCFYMRHHRNEVRQNGLEKVIKFRKGRAHSLFRWQQLLSYTLTHIYDTFICFYAVLFEIVNYESKLFSCVFIA